MRLVELRELLNSALQAIYSKPRTELESILTKLNVPIAENATTKSALLRESLLLVPDGELISSTIKLLELQVLQCETRTTLEDALWKVSEIPQIHGRMRREIGEALNGQDLHLHKENFNFLLWSLFCISPYSPSHFMFEADTSVARDIYQHVHQNPDDWNFSLLFSEIGAFECCTQRFILLLEGLASSRVRPDMESQLRFVAATNTALHPNGFEMRHVSEEDGYPVFRLVSRHAAIGKPKNVIFASSVKPDIVLKANPALYAKNVAGDRDLKLAGYEVYRFGGAELQTENAASVMVRSLFASSFIDMELLIGGTGRNDHRWTPDLKRPEAFCLSRDLAI